MPNSNTAAALSKIVYQTCRTALGISSSVLGVDLHLNGS